MSLHSHLLKLLPMKLQPLKVQTLGFQPLLTLGLHPLACPTHRQSLQRHLGQMCPQRGQNGRSQEVTLMLSRRAKGKAKASSPRSWNATGVSGRATRKDCAHPLPAFAGKPSAESCGNCKDKVQNNSQCTSKGGGKHEQPGFQQPGKGKGKDGGGKGWGNGFGNQGGKGSSKGRGKGKGKGVYGLDDQYWQPDWNQGPDWSLAQAGTHAAHQHAATQQPQFPWMAAAAAPPSDPWSSWPSSPQWPPGGVNSVTQKPRSLSSLAPSVKKLPVVFPQVPNADEKQFQRAR